MLGSVKSWTFVWWSSVSSISVYDLYFKGWYQNITMYSLQKISLDQGRSDVSVDFTLRKVAKFRTTP